jgi:hypothetical protein
MLVSPIELLFFIKKSYFGADQRAKAKKTGSGAGIDTIKIHT